MQNPIEAITVDSREPDWVQALEFGGAPKLVAELPAGDLHVICADMETLIIERKTSSDLLNTLREGRLFNQVARLAEERSRGAWPYLLITGELRTNSQRMLVVYRDRQWVDTGWEQAAIEGAFIQIQQAGVPIIRMPTDGDIERAVNLLVNMNREKTMRVPPARIPVPVAPEVAFIAQLPGIGVELAQRTIDLYKTPSAALAALKSTDAPIPGVGLGKRAAIKEFLK